ncbi:unnamed protein product, partial [Heterosigma akashiwo]
QPAAGAAGGGAGRFGHAPGRGRRGRGADGGQLDAEPGSGRGECERPGGPPGCSGD